MYAYRFVLADNALIHFHHLRDVVATRAKFKLLYPLIDTGKHLSKMCGPFQRIAKHL